MSSKFHLFSQILLLGLINNIALLTPVKAQNSNVECRQAIANATNRLQTSANSRSIVSIKNTKNDYPDAPANRKEIIGFYLDYLKDPRPQVISGIEKILNSPQLMKTISQDMINKCSSIGAVYFSGTVQAGCPLYVGLMPDGRVQFFEWVAPGELNREIKWGENYCT